MAKSRTEIAWAAVKAFGWPAAIALAVVAYGILSPWQPPTEWKEGAKTFFATVFFVMYFYGQYKRVEKQDVDEDSFKDVNEKLVSLADLVKKLAPSAPPPQVAPAQPAGTRDSTSLLLEARELMAQGHVLAALLQGGVAFEHALRAFARRYKSEQDDFTNLLELIRRLELVLPKEFIGELHALRMIRNRMSHVSEGELADLPDAGRILTAYEAAVDRLGKSEHGA